MIPVKILALRYLASAEPGLARSLGAPEGYPSLAMLTTDCDDATYIALDEATKAADVKVCYARSFYAGAANATTPNAGEVIGILAGPTPGAVRSGMEAALSALCRGLTVYPQRLVNVRAEKAALETAAVQAAIRAAEEKLQTRGRLLVRPSATEPVIRVMVEASSQAVCEECVQSVVDVICAQGHARI